MREAAVSILFVIRSLEVGGAQRQLVTLAAGLHDRGLRIAVAVFYPGGALQGELEQRGVPVHSLRKRSWADVAGFGWRLIRVVRQENPDVVYSFMAGANVFAALAKQFWGPRRQIWGIRASNIDVKRYNSRLRLMEAAGRHLASRADLYIANSSAGAAHHVRLGYSAARMRVIPNGIDTDRFVPDSATAPLMRAQWRLSPGERTVGLVARLDPMKDHDTFLSAIALLIKQGHSIRAVCVGAGPESYAHGLRERAEQLDLNGQVEWIAQALDMPDLYRSLDVAVSASAFGEGFGNVIAEAMSCGVPCVVTDVGDSAEIVGRTGKVVPPRDPRALAEGIAYILATRSSASDAACRARIVNNFGIPRMLDRTEQLIDDIL